MELPPVPDGDLIHHRSYDVHSYRLASDRMMLRGIVHDQKPPGIYFDNDPDPLSVHHMVVDLTMLFPTLEIVAVEVTMNVTPHTGCSKIEPDYQQLVGLSIARGFSRSVKNLFGGPSGCTHIGALLQAMAPVAVQSMWSMTSKNDHAAELDPDEAERAKQRARTFNLNTCHIWAEDGEQILSLNRGEPFEVPVWAKDRLEKLGRDPEEWNNR